MSDSFSEWDPGSSLGSQTIFEPTHCPYPYLATPQEPERQIITMECAFILIKKEPWTKIYVHHQHRDVPAIVLVFKNQKFYCRYDDGLQLNETVHEMLAQTDKHKNKEFIHDFWESTFKSLLLPNIWW